MARIWFYNIPYHGHVNPTLRLVRALVQGGDEVTYFSSPAFQERIEATGAVFRAYQNGQAFEASRNNTHIIFLGSLVAQTTHAVLPEVLADVGAEQPELIMFDMSAPWGAIASRRFDIPTVASFPHLPFTWRTIFDDARVFRKVTGSLLPGEGHWRSLMGQTAAIIKDHKLRNPRDINVLSSSADLNLVFSSRYFQPYAETYDSSYLFIGPDIETERREEPLAITRQPGQRLLYIAVGTVYQASRQFFQDCFEAFSDPRFAVVLSVGRAVDPADLGEAPPNFTVAQYVPQLSVLQEADLFITHGGMNSINEAILYGVPLVVVPNTIEQTTNALRIEQLHAGLYLDHQELTVEKLRDAVLQVLTDREVPTGLQRIQESFAASGGVPRAVSALQAFKSSRGIT
jgi:MGT family glycosyltransferase